MFYVGQKVVCVDASSGNGTLCWGEKSETLIEGNVYTIRRCFYTDYARKGVPELIVWLDEIARSALSRHLWGQDAGYAARRFRPLIEKKTDISVFTSLLKHKQLEEV
jgi:hypothetical protein